MKTLIKFETPSAVIKLSMTTAKDKDFLKGTYKVSETPKSKKNNWKEEIAYYDYNEDAKEDIKKRIDFWL